MRLFAVAILFAAGCAIPVQPQPIPVPPDNRLDGLAEKTRLAWAKYAGLHADGAEAVAKDIESGKLTTPTDVLDALEAKADAAKQGALTDIAGAFIGADVAEMPGLLREIAKGERWHSTTVH